MRNGIDIRAGLGFPIDDRVGEAPKWVHAKAGLGLGAQLLVSFNQFGNSFKLSQEGERNFASLKFRVGTLGHV